MKKPNQPTDQPTKETQKQRNKQTNGQREKNYAIYLGKQKASLYAAAAAVNDDFSVSFLFRYVQLYIWFMCS